MIGALLDKAIAPFAPGWALTRQVRRQQLAMLATYKAADTGRANQDWRGTTSGSADLAIIPDSRIINQRARQMVRDSWIAASAVKAASRNVVGSGITPVPAAHDAKGAPLAKVNERLAHLFKQWATKAAHCDVEARQNFVQKQTQLVEERFTSGNGFVVWSYKPPENRNDPVGLKFQSFEPEMLDTTKQWYSSNEVRGGVEIDEDGKPVAYHFWTRNPADYLFRRQMHSVRIPAARVLHYYKQDRVLQTLGVTPLAPVMQDMRDFARNQQAALWAAIMQTCLGAAITKNMPSGLGGLGGMGGPPASGDTGITASGMRKIDFVPGTVIELAPGEDVKFLTPQSPGGQYGPFTDNLLRGIGAGMGISYGLLARHFDGNYSAARQDMLEDDKQWGPEQDLLTGTVIDPLYVLFVRFAASEGRLDDITDEFQLGEFLYDESRFTAAEHITPARPWIDPEKEMNAYEKALTNHLKTREQIVTEMGGRFRTVWQAKSQEQRLSRTLGLDLPEDSLPEFRRELIQTIAGDPNANSSVTNAVDLVAALNGEGVTIRPDFKQQNIKPPDNGASPAIGASGTGEPTPGRITIPPQSENGNGNGISRMSAFLSADGYDYSSTQVNLPTDLAGKVLALSHQIPDEDLAEGGREIQPHCTVKYGLQTGDADRVRGLLSGVAPVRMKLGKVTIFNGSDADVVVIDVSSPDLVKLNEAISRLPHVDTHPAYRPHVTVAYVKPGLGEKYAGMNDLDGQEATIDRVTFSSKNGVASDIQLRAKAAAMGVYDVWSGSTAVNAPPTKPPGYRLSVLPSVRCGTCSNLDVNATTRSQPPTNAMTNPQPFCRRYNSDVAEDHACDTWTAAEVNADTNVNRGRTLPPYPAPGSAPLDRNFDSPAAEPGTATP